MHTRDPAVCLQSRSYSRGATAGASSADLVHKNSLHTIRLSHVMRKDTSIALNMLGGDTGNKPSE